MDFAVVLVTEATIITGWLIDWLIDWLTDWTTVFVRVVCRNCTSCVGDSRHLHEKAVDSITSVVQPGKLRSFGGKSVDWPIKQFLWQSACFNHVDQLITRAVATKWTFSRLHVLFIFVHQTWTVLSFYLANACLTLCQFITTQAYFNVLIARLCDRPVVREHWNSIARRIKVATVVTYSVKVDCLFLQTVDAKHDV